MNGISRDRGLEEVKSIFEMKENPGIKLNGGWDLGTTCNRFKNLENEVTMSHLKYFKGFD